MARLRVSVECPNEWESGYIFRNKEYPINIELIGKKVYSHIETVYGVEIDMVDIKGQTIAKGETNSFYIIIGDDITISIERKMEIKIKMIKLSYDIGNCQVRMRFRVGKELLGRSPFIRIINYKLIQNMDRIPR